MENIVFSILQNENNYLMLLNIFGSLGKIVIAQDFFYFVKLLRDQYIKRALRNINVQ